ncbi:MAG TPA: Fe-S cluster assembly protein SufD [Xanthomonadaceae bacterium]|nr:Fe-S cluster assembly protein SufD [Xanthomonadaceae bacterium]
MSEGFVHSLLDDFKRVEAGLPGAAHPWLQQARRENLEAFAQSGLPSSRHELWKYTVLHALDKRSFALPRAAAAPADLDLALAGVDGPRLVFVNGRFEASLSRLGDLPEGLSLRSLGVALQGEAEPLRFQLSRLFGEGDEGFARLNAACASDGVLLRVAAGTRVAPPVHLVFAGSAVEVDLAWHLRNLIEIEDGAELSLVEHWLDVATPAHLGNVIGHVNLGRDARLAWVRVQASGATSLSIARNEVALAEGATLVFTGLDLGAALARHDLLVKLNGQGARFEAAGAFLLGDRQHGDTRLEIRHEAPGAACDVRWRGVADDKARGVFNGTIHVAPGADGTAAQLSSRNLLLSSSAEIDTRPVLEIHADDVTAAHGATVGQLDEQALFYLRTRGIAQAEARAMLTLAFVREAVERVEPEPLREALAAMLAAKL